MKTLEERIEHVNRSTYKKEVKDYVIKLLQAKTTYERKAIIKLEFGNEKICK